MKLDIDKWRISCVLISSVFIVEINCVRQGERLPPGSAKHRFNDVSQAINYISAHLPAAMSMQERCRRYAVLSHLALLEKRPHESTVLKVLNMDEHSLTTHYDAIDVNRVSELYMSAIDRYRITELAPPLIDLVECLRRIESPAVKAYLGNWEMVIIVHLYRQVLGLPHDGLNLDDVDYTQLHPAFLFALRNLFSQYLDLDTVFAGTPLKAIESSTDCPKMIAEASTDDKQHRKEIMLNRRREQSRLAQQRLRLLHQSKRDNNIKYQRARRERMQSLLCHSANSSIANEWRRKQKANREREYAKRRLRRRLLREQGDHQLYLALLNYSERCAARQNVQQDQRMPDRGHMTIEEQRPSNTVQPNSSSILIIPDALHEFRPLVHPMTPWPKVSQPPPRHSPSLPPAGTSFDEADGVIEDQQDFSDLMTTWLPLQTTYDGQRVYEEKRTPPTEFYDTDTVLQMLSDHSESSGSGSLPSDRSNDLNSAKQGYA